MYTLSQNNRNEISKIYKYIGISLLFTIIGAYIGSLNPSIFNTWTMIGGFLVQIGLLIFMYTNVDNDKRALLTLNAFTFLSGVMIAPLLMRTLSIDPALLINAILATMLTVISLSLYTLNTKRDFSGMGKYLFAILLVVIVLSIANIFIGSSLLHLGLAIGSAILFSFYLIYDTQKILNGEYQSPVLAAVGVYLDILNLFISLLQIFVSLSDDD